MPAGIPRTELERRERHRSLYGNEPPADRLGNQGQEWETVWTAPEDDTLAIFTVITVIGVRVAKAVGVKGAVVILAVAVHAIDIWREKRRRKKAGLPPQPQLTLTPFMDQKTGTASFRFTITGTYPGRRVMLKMGKGLFYGIRDPIVADRYGDGTIELSGDHLLEEARRKKIIDIGLPQITSGTKRIWVYVQESRPRLGDLRSPITMVEVKVEGVVPKLKSNVAKDLLGFVILSADEAKALINAGKPCFIKSIFPIISMFPGLPYTPGMWVPWGCVITDIQ